MRIDDARLIDVPKVNDARGNLSFIEEERHVPFRIRRVFYVYDLPTEAARGAHAHKELHEFVVCLSGGVDIEIDDGRAKKTVHLNRPWRGLHIPPGLWRSLGNFDPGTVYLVLASHLYDEADYIRDYDAFLAWAAEQDDSAAR